MTPLIESKVLPPAAMDLKLELDENLHELGSSAPRILVFVLVKRHALVKIKRSINCMESFCE